MVLRVVVLHDEILDPGVRQRRLERLPVDGAVAEVGPAVLVGVRAGGGDVLEVDGGQAPAEGLDPLEGIGAALDDPGEVGLPFEVGAALEDRDLGDGAVGELLELEGVVVPAEAEAGVAVGLGRLLEALAEGDVGGAGGRGAARG